MRATLAALLATRRGDPFLGASACSVLDHERRRLDELTLTITERLYQCRLAEGDTSIIGDLTRLCLDHPVRESLWALLIRAHYQAGNQADALRTATTLRINLRDELGVDPSRELQQLELQILDHDVPHTAPTRGTPRIDSSAASTLHDEEVVPASLPRRLVRRSAVVVRRSRARAGGAAGCMGECHGGASAVGVGVG